MPVNTGGSILAFRKLIHQKCGCTVLIFGVLRIQTGHFTGIVYASLIMQTQTPQTPLSEVRIRKHLNADALIKGVRDTFKCIKECRAKRIGIPLVDVLMSAFAMFLLKDPSLLAFDRRKGIEKHNIKALYGVEKIPCDTQMRTRLDPLDPDSIRPAYKEVFSRLQRGKILEKMTFLYDYYIISIDGTGYFSSSKLYSPACLEKHSSKTGKISYYLQILGAAIVHPNRREVIPLPPEFIRKQDGQTKNDCERNACRRWLEEFRKEHPHLKVIITEDGLSSNAPHIRDLMEYDCRFILGVKEGDHAYLFDRLAEAVKQGLTSEYTIQDSSNPKVQHLFRFANGIPLNKSNQDLLVNVLEYWEITGAETQYFSWITDFTLTNDNVYQIMR